MQAKVPFKQFIYLSLSHVGSWKSPKEHQLEQQKHKLQQ